jgi:hypothetical protein
VDVPLPPRLFSLREANALIGTLSARFARARAIRDELMEVQKQLADSGRELEGPQMQIDASAPPAVQALQARAVDAIARLKELLREISELGVEVKAADGLVDFRSKLHGRTVYLCWKYGEERIGYFHELEAGFAGRQPLPEGGDFTGDLLH